MKIGLISDTHGRTSGIRQAVAAIGPVDIWLHAGDYSHDANILKDMTGLDIIAVRGNCDPLPISAKFDEFIELSGKKIWLTHGHRYNVGYDTSELVWWGKKYEIDIVVFGHTHVPHLSANDGLILVNPGSPFLPRRGYGQSCAILEITDKVDVRFISLCAVK